jgi:anti-sigma factor RsiW
MLMKPDNKTCNPELLSRFTDDELESGEQIRIREHVVHCPSCRRDLYDHRTISALFTAGVKRELLEARFEKVEESVLSLIQKKSMPWWVDAWKSLLSRKFYVPAAAAAAVLLFLLLPAGPKPHASGPSAVVSYLGGEVESVMILETERSRRTIVWFSEALVSGDESGKVQDKKTVV